MKVIEHRRLRLRCPGCGRRTRAKLPEQVAGCFGAGLEAAVATFSVRNRVSRDDAVEFCEELFGARISSGTVDAIIGRAAAALTEPHEDHAKELLADTTAIVTSDRWWAYTHLPLVRR